MEVAGILNSWECPKLVPADPDGVLDVSADPEFPLFTRNGWLDAEVEDGEVMDLTLSRGDAIRGGPGLQWEPAAFAGGPAFLGGNMGVIHGWEGGLNTRRGQVMRNKGLQ